MNATGAEIALRPATVADEAFCFELYADRRARDLDAVEWPESERGAFLTMQFRAQQSGYSAEYPDADHWIVWADGSRVGRLLATRPPEEHVVVDIVILSQWRGRGIGTALMREVIAGARAAGARVRLTVESNNVALVAWYRRLGFREAERNEVHTRMVFSARDRLAGFAEAVYEDPRLQRALAGVTERAAFVSRVVTEATARGFDVEAGDVEDALRQSQRESVERWV